ncbi:MAG: hypothetical protein J7M05_06995 [Anaerolineae bacterium]|nr:hypothetical protein [Anaerolineae bacterium]
MCCTNHQRIARIILGFFFLLSFIYSLVNPVFEAPDEVYHYPYIKHLADGRGLPVQRPDHKELWEQEGSQPPLYYALAAALTWWIDTDDLPQVRRLNPHARIGIPLARDNKNMTIHTARESFPWRGTTLAVHLIRFFSILLGAGTLWCTYRLGLLLFPGQPLIALGAMALNALIPMFAFISGSVNNDNLVNLLASLVLFLLVQVVQGRESGRLLLGLGVLIGLACLAKLSALGLFPLSALAFFLAGLSSKERSFGERLWQCMKRCLLVWGIAVLISGWWYWRNWCLYRDPTGISAMLDIFGRRSRVPSFPEILGEFEGFRISFWGLFGVVNVLLKPHWLYRVLDAFTLLAVLGLLRQAWRVYRERRLPCQWRELLLLAVWIVTVCVSLLRWTSMTKASQGRLIYPAISAISLYLILGLYAWFAERRWPVVLGTMAVSLGLLSLTAPFTAIRPSYLRPPIISADDVPSTARPFLATYGGVMRLLAYELAPSRVRPGEEVAVTLYWQALAPMQEDLSLYIHIFGRKGERLGQRDSYPGRGTFPTSLWSPGQVIEDVYYVPIRPDAQGPVAARVEVGLYRLRTMAPLPVVDAQGRPVGQPVLGRIKVAVPTQKPLPPHPLDANVADRVKLLGYDLPQKVHPGESVPLSLYWEVVGHWNQDYTVFVQLLDREGRIIGQGDGPPLEGDYPTSFWEPGEYLLDEHLLQVSPQAPVGERGRLIVGFYDLETGRRLPVLDAQGRPQGDEILLTTVQIVQR